MEYLLAYLIQGPSQWQRAIITHKYIQLVQHRLDGWFRGSRAARLAVAVLGRLPLRACCGLQQLVLFGYEHELETRYFKG